jgi:hypothetical protein
VFSSPSRRHYTEASPLAVDGSAQSLHVSGGSGVSTSADTTSNCAPLGKCLLWRLAWRRLAGLDIWSDRNMRPPWRPSGSCWIAGNVWRCAVLPGTAADSHLAPLVSTQVGRGSGGGVLQQPASGDRAAARNAPSARTLRPISAPTSAPVGRCLGGWADRRTLSPRDSTPRWLVAPSERMTMRAHCTRWRGDRDRLVPRR